MSTCRQCGQAITSTFYDDQRTGRNEDAFSLNVKKKEIENGERKLSASLCNIDDDVITTIHHRHPKQQYTTHEPK